LTIHGLRQRCVLSVCVYLCASVRLFVGVSVCVCAHVLCVCECECVGIIVLFQV
jgi:hypothetical protein